MEFKKRTLSQIADFICGSRLDDSVWGYRSSHFLTTFFGDCDTEYEHDGSTRPLWVIDVLTKILAEPSANAQTPPETFSRVYPCTHGSGRLPERDA